MKIAALLGVSVVLSFAVILLKDKSPGYALAVSVLGGVFLLWSIVGGIVPILSEMRDFLPIDGVDTVPVLKALGIGYITAESSDILKTVGEEGLSRWVNIYGKVMITLVTLPVIKSLFESVKGLL